MLSKLRVQYTTKAMCALADVPGAPKDTTAACLDALVAAGLTKPMPPGYMAEWPDEVSSASLDSVSAYDRKARALLFKTCVEMRDLREGRFACGEAQADHVLKVTKSSDTQAGVRYERTLNLSPSLAALDGACGAVTRPAPEGNVTLEKVDGKWALAHDEPAPK
jgi:hypothetical protein